MSKIWLDSYAPRTAFILGAALTGGDPVAATHMILSGEGARLSEDREHFLNKVEVKAEHVTDEDS